MTKRQMNDPLLTAELEVDGHLVTLTFSPRRRPPGMNWREYTAKPRLYVSVEEETLLDNLINRTSRPHLTCGAILRPAIKQLGFADMRIRWSQKAGCSCSCSPGFIVTNPPALKASWVDEKGEVWDKDYMSTCYDIEARISDVITATDSPEREQRAKALGL